MADVDLSTYVLDFGKHRGTRIQRVPVGYLNWLTNQRVGPWQIAQRELDRRGTVMPTIELSGHAIDAASLRIRRVWHEQREQTEGLHAWLCRATAEAIAANLPMDTDKFDSRDTAFFYVGVKWVVFQGEEYPVLKTVIPVPMRWKTMADEHTCPACRERRGKGRNVPDITCTNPNGCRCVLTPKKPLMPPTGPESE